MTTTTTASTTTATTTDRPSEPRRAKQAPRIGLSAQEWRLYLLSGLAAVYTAAWLALAAGVDPAPVASAPGDAPAVAPGPATVWIDQLPPAARPVVVLPPGWMLASPSTTVTTVRAAIPATRATPTPRRVRVRTRSS
ncbi:MAG: hypothetical protein K8W52_22285 [Deltaproteobacteria bacterium]|nr:hypothetical protein [Deltaproteobacteria bacterium]